MRVQEKQFSKKKMWYNKTMKKVIYVLCCILCISQLGACSSKEQVFSKSAFYFDTQISISIYANKKDAETILDECMDLCEQMEQIFSRNDENSELYKINHRTSNTVAISSHMKKVIETGLEAYEISNHKFDITIAPLLEIYSFQNNPKVPTQDQLIATLPKVDAGTIKLSENTLVFENSETKIDLGGLAKGYIADILKEYLENRNVKNALINLGGNVLCINTKSDGTAWKVGIQKPFDEKGEALYVVKADDVSVVSSGIYERNFEQAGILYHHLLDATTGLPCNNGLWQVSIITSSSLKADMLSSVVFLMGLKEGMQYIESLEDTEAIFVDENEQLYVSSGLKE